MFNRKNIIKAVITLATLVIFINVNASAQVCDNFNSNIKKLDNTVTIESSKSFINNDKEYLNNKPSTSDIKKEISNLEERLKKINNEHETIKGIKIYKGNTGLKNNALRTAIKNRESYINNSNSFKYDESTIYNIDRDYTKEAGTNKYFKQEDMDLTYEAIVEVINNIELDTKFLNNTTFVVSPFILEGMNGYTVSRNNNHSTIVISNHVFGAPADWIKLSTRSTVLHEIGHVFQYSNKNKFENNLVAKEYLVQADKKLTSGSTKSSSETAQWQSSVNENFAEDFRTHFSSKLGNNSFEPLAKKTSAEYNQSEFSEVISEIIK